MSDISWMFASGTDHGVDQALMSRCQRLAAAASATWNLVTKYNLATFLKLAREVFIEFFGKTPERAARIAFGKLKELLITHGPQLWAKLSTAPAIAGFGIGVTVVYFCYKYMTKKINAVIATGDETLEMAANLERGFEMPPRPNGLLLNVQPSYNGAASTSNPEAVHLLTLATRDLREILEAQRNIAHLLKQAHLLSQSFSDLKAILEAQGQTLDGFADKDDLICHILSLNDTSGSSVSRNHNEASRARPYDQDLVDIPRARYTAPDLQEDLDLQLDWLIGLSLSDLDGFWSIEHAATQQPTSSSVSGSSR